MRNHSRSASLRLRIDCRALVLLFLLLNLTPALALGQEATITTIAGNGVLTNSGDGGLATEVGLNDPWDICFDPAGHMYIVERSSQRIRRVDKNTGIITTAAGTVVFGYYGGFSGDGGPATDARLYYPRGAVIDELGSMYIVDSNNNRIRKVDGATGLISTVAGNGLAPFSGDGAAATAAGLHSPLRVALDASGNLYIADVSHHRIRRVDAITGIISTVAGDGVPDQADPGPGASLYAPRGVAVDTSGNILVASSGDHRVIRVDAVTGQITTVAGDGAAGHAGDDGPASSAQLDNPVDVCLDRLGNLYILCKSTNDSDPRNNPRVRRVDAATGVITTVAGNGTQGYSGDGGTATDASLAEPNGIAVDAAGDLYIADTDNNRIRKVHFRQPVPDIALSTTSLSFGGVTVGQWGPQSFSVSNTGNADLVVTGISSSEGEFSLSHHSWTESAGGSTVVTVDFAPSGLGAQSGTLTITSNDPDAGSLTIALSGTGVVGKSVGIFGGSGGSYLETLTGLLEADGHTVSDRGMNANTAGIDVAILLRTNDSDDRQLSLFKALGAFALEGGLLITEFNGANVLNHTNLLDATADGSRLDLGSKASVTFREPDVGIAKGLGGGYSDPHRTGLFVSLSIGPSVDVLATIGGTKRDGTPISPGIPAIIGGKSGSGSTLVIAFTWYNFFGYANDKIRQLIRNAVNYDAQGQGGLPTPNISSNKASLSFGAIPVGQSGAQSFTVSNSGNADLSVTGISSSDGQFIASPSSFTVGAGSSTPVTVTFTPSGTGAQSGTITITSNDPDEGSVTVSLSGIGVAAGSSLQLDGVNGFAVSGQKLSVSTSAITMETWFKITSTSGEHKIIHFHTADYQDIYLSFEGGTVWWVIYEPSPITAHKLRATATVGEWHHWAGTYDGSTMRMFLDGTEVTSFVAEENKNFTTPLAINDFVMVGRHAVPSAVHHFPGVMDEVRIWGVAKTPAEISTNYSTEISGNEPGLLAYYNFNEGSGTVATDVSGNGLNLTVATGATFSVETPFPKSSPAISLSASTLALEAANVGSSFEQTLTVTNTGSGDLAISGITVGGTDAAQFTVSPTTATVAAGGSETITVTFTPTSVGAKTASLSITHDAAGSPSAVTLSGTGVAANIVLSTSSLSFGDVQLGQSRTRNLTISYTPDDPGKTRFWYNLQFSDSQFVSFPAGIRVTAGEPKTIQVTFSPATAKDYTANLTLVNTNPEEPPLVVSLAGKGIGTSSSPVIKEEWVRFINNEYVGLPGRSYTFDNPIQVGDTHDVTLWIKNNGSTDLLVSDLVFSEWEGSGYVNQAGYPTGATSFTVPPTVKVALLIRWSPTSTGEAHGTLTILSNDPETPALVLELHAIPGVADSGAGVASSLKFEQKVWLWIGHNWGDDWFSTARIDEINSKLGEVVTTIINALGLDTWSLSTQHLRTLEPLGCVITTNNQDYSITQFGRNVTKHIPEIGSNLVVFILKALADSPRIPDIALSVDSLSFGNVAIGQSLNLTLVISNTGNGPLAVTSISSSDGEFTLGSSPFTVGAGRITDFPVTFTPSSAGAKSGTLKIVSDDPDEGIETVSLSGTGMASLGEDPNIRLSLSAFGFEDTEVGRVGTRTFDVSNTGGGILVVSSILSSASDFVVFPSSFALASGSSQTVTVNFVPKTSGNQSGFLTVISSDSDHGSVQVVVVGNGVLLLPALGVTGFSVGPMRSGAVASVVPEFFWGFQGEFGDSQTAWQIQVGSSPGVLDNDVWDSGKQEGANRLVNYDGTPLEWDRVYGIRIRIWNSTDVASDWQSTVVRTLNNLPPLVTITSPPDGSREVWSPERRLQFSGIAKDQDQDGVAIVSIAWVSDLDGVLHLGTSVQHVNFSRRLDSLAIGEHRLSLTAWDNEGDSSQTIVTLQISGLPPVAHIDSAHAAGREFDREGKKLDALWGSDAFGFSGSGVDEDEFGASIVSHRWTVREAGELDAGERLLSEEASFEIPAREVTEPGKNKGVFQLLYRVVDNEGVESEADSVKLTIRPDIGRAIIVAGGGYQGENREVFYGYTSRVANRTYSLLNQQRRFSHEFIEYLSPIEDWGEAYRSAIRVADRDISVTRLKTAIERAEESNVGGVPLMIFLVGHGGEGVFYLNDTEELGGVEFSSWLDALNNAKVLRRGLTGVEEIPSGEVVVVVDFCYSRRFLEQISGPGRVVIGSSSDKVASVTKSGDSFGSFFFEGIGKGWDVHRSFEEARDRIRSLFDQEPYVDANGDAIPLYSTERNVRNPGTEEDERILKNIEIGGFWNLSRLSPEIYDAEATEGANSGTVAVTARADSGLKLTLSIIPADFDASIQGSISSLTSVDLDFTETQGDTSIYAGVVGVGDQTNYILLIQGIDQLGNVVGHWAIGQTRSLIAGDFDGDGKVGFPDFIDFARHFGKTSQSESWDPVFDLDDDGEVGFSDFVQFASAFGTGAET